MRTIRSGFRRRVWALGLLAVAVLAAGVTGCGRAEPEYSRSSPEAAIDSAKRMVADGNAERLAELIYAEDEYQRAVLDRFGSMLGHWQDLAAAVAERFPEEVNGLKEQAREAAARGEAGSMLGGLLTGQRVPRQRRNAGGEGQREAFEASIKQLFADPYGWLEGAESKLDYQYIHDDAVALTWDKRMILPPVGLVMERDSTGQWAVVLPTRLPVVREVMPKTPEEYAIWGSLVRVFDNLAIDLEKDVREGKVATLEDLSRRAGERAFPVAVLVVYAYSRLKDAGDG